MNKKNDKNNNDFANFTALDTAAIFELDAKCLEVIGGGNSTILAALSVRAKAKRTRRP